MYIANRLACPMEAEPLCNRLNLAMRVLFGFTCYPRLRVFASGLILLFLCHTTVEGKMEGAAYTTEEAFVVLFVTAQALIRFLWPCFFGGISVVFLGAALYLERNKKRNNIFGDKTETEAIQSKKKEIAYYLTLALQMGLMACLPFFFDLLKFFYKGGGCA